MRISFKTASFIAFCAFMGTFAAPAWAGLVPSVQFSTPTETVNETTGAFSVTVTQSAVSVTDTFIPFTLGGTAVAGIDFSGVTASPLVISAGQISGTITGNLLSDPGISTETLTFTLGTPLNATLGATTVNTLSISQPTASVPEPASFKMGMIALPILGFWLWKKRRTLKV